MEELITGGGNWWSWDYEESTWGPGGRVFGRVYCQLSDSHVWRRPHDPSFKPKWWDPNYYLGPCCREPGSLGFLAVIFWRWQSSFICTSWLFVCESVL